MRNMFTGNFENSVNLMRSMLKRDKMYIIIWVVLLVAFSALLAPGVNAMFPDEEARLTVVQIYDNPLMISMMGPIYGKDAPGGFPAGAMYSGFMLVWVILAVSVMNLFYVVRNTRGDEERGRAEVVRSLPVGRLANLNATMLSALIMNTALGLFTGLGIAVMGVEGIGFGGSMLYGLVLGLSGQIFAAITAVFCQLSASPSGAASLSGITLGALYMVRGAGDSAGNDFLACLSPMGLASRSQIYVENYIWPSLVIILLTVIITALAFRLNTIRDLGQGFIAAKPGRAEAKKSMLSPFGLSWRLLRTGLIAWVIIMFMTAASYGSVLGDLPKFIGDSPEYLQVIGIPEAMLDVMSDDAKAEIIVTYFMAFISMMMTLVCIVPAILAAMKPRSEEREGRAEHIIARVVSRWKYMCGFVTLAFILSVIMQFAVAFGLYSVTESILETNPIVFSELLKAYLVYLPAVWVMIGFAVFITGLLPKASSAVWGFYGFVAFLSFIGGMVDLPEVIKGISPMHHIPQLSPTQLPLGELSYPPLIILTVIAAVLTVAGFYFYGKRDTLTGM
ncbi:MAG: hypothetical protein FWE14_12910 [Lachnospiraceae bacterium]|nr:hypothetical protein [Lachnospiraceae bacterium]